MGAKTAADSTTIRKLWRKSERGDSRDMDNKEGKIRAFFSRFFRTSELKDADDIFALGFVNSLFAMQLVTWLEKEFAFTIKDEDLDVQNFNSIDAISGFISRKTPTAVGA
jgi:methoxymalonate biosynthesis acyl carrier protein